jgi:hypothetical protein
MTNPESILHQQVADYLRLQYPDVLFHSDFGSGVKLTINQAIRQKRLNGGRRAWPDLFIAESKKKDVVTEVFEDGIKVTTLDRVREFAGLMIELKKEGTRLKKKNGDWATPHIAEQAAVLEELRKRGYKAEFAVGFDGDKGAKKIIDNYLKGEK